MEDTKKAMEIYGFFQKIKYSLHHFLQYPKWVN